MNIKTRMRKFLKEVKDAQARIFVWAMLFVFSVISLGTAIVSVSEFFTGSVGTADATSTSDTTSYVSVGELLSSGTELDGNISFSLTNLNTLIQYITGYADADITQNGTNLTATMNALSEAACLTSSSKDIRANVVGDKTSSQDVQVTLGGLNWQVMYLSKDNDGDIIVTLWLDNNHQSAWTKRSSTEGAYYGYVSGYLYSDWAADWYSSSTGNYPSNMYSTSYINAVTLNNGGYYATSVSEVTSASQVSDSAFALFTMSQYGLTDYLVTPSQVSWQETESAVATVGSSYNCSNDAYGTPSTGSFYSSDSNYSSKTYYADWANNYLWLPSMAETGYNTTHTGIWGTSTYQRINDNGSTTSVSGSVGSSNVNVATSLCTYSWLRSAYIIDCSGVCNLYPSGTNTGCSTVDISLAVRPALHLNLSSAALCAAAAENTTDLAYATVEPIETQQINDFSPATPEVVVKLNGVTLTKDVDYTVTYTNNTTEGTATVTITGKGSYTGSINAYFDVESAAINISNTTIELGGNSFEWTGSEITTAVTVKYGDVTLEENTHYTLAYSNNTNAGTATITVTGMGDNFTGTTTVTFEIVRRSLETEDRISVDYTSSVTYTGSALTPTVTVTDTSLGTTLTSGTHYTITYSNNTNAGTATITITGTGNYTGTMYATFTITQKEFSAATITISAIADQTYTGSAITPTITVTDNDLGELQLNTDYTVTYSDNTNAGTATITITGTGNYTGTTTATFTITQKEFSAATITISAIADQTYTGSAITPTITVTDNDLGELQLNTDYTVTYSDNTNAGTATITITGTGNYTGTMYASFTITQKEFSAAAITISAIENQTYTGSEITPTITVTDNALGTLELNTDYTVTYSDNINAGTATITVTGTGNYTGTTTASFTIEKAQPIITISATYKADAGVNVADIVALSAGDTAGTLMFDPAVVTSGENLYSYTFTPTDSTNYNTVTGTVTITGIVVTSISAVSSVNLVDGESFDPATITITATYSDTSVRNIASGDCVFNLTTGESFVYGTNLVVSYYDSVQNTYFQDTIIVLKASLTQGNVIVTGVNGIAEGVALTLQKETEQEAIEASLGGNYDYLGDINTVYSVSLTKDGDPYTSSELTISFDVSEFTGEQSFYLVVNGKVMQVSAVNGKIETDGGSSVMLIVVDPEEQTNHPLVTITVVLSVIALVLILAVIYIVIRKNKK